MGQDYLFQDHLIRHRMTHIFKNNLCIEIPLDVNVFDRNSWKDQIRTDSVQQPLCRLMTRQNSQK